MYILAAAAGLVVGAVLGVVVGVAIALGAMTLIQYQDTPPDYAFLPFLVGVVAGPLWAVRRLRRTHRSPTPHQRNPLVREPGFSGGPDAPVERADPSE